MDFQSVDRWLEENYPQMERDLCDSLRIPSVKGKPEPGKPFGAEVDDALNHMLGLCGNMGFRTENQAGYVGIADFCGSAEGQVGVLAHLDVVPAEASRWTTPPYEPTVRDGAIFARGAVDDKGPAFAALYAGKALMECGFVPKKTIRYIFGGDEESGCGCMLYYTAHNPPPDCGFTPDGSFPAIVGEKGGGMFTLAEDWKDVGPSDSLRLKEVRAGTAINVIPERAEAVFVYQDGFDAELPRMEGITVETNGDRLSVTASGKGGHCSTPWEGDNAIMTLLAYLDQLEFSPGPAKAYIRKLRTIFDDPRYGTGLGIASQDEFGKLTNVPSILHMDERSGGISCDMRTPVTRSPKFYREIIEETACTYGMRVEGWDDYPELYVAEKSDLVQTLMKVYREATGDMSKPLMIGGGTYAKHFKNFVAFGPQKQGTPELAHQADECISCEYLLEIAKIYARTIYELAK